MHTKVEYEFLYIFAFEKKKKYRFYTQTEKFMHGLTCNSCFLLLETCNT